MTDSTRHHVFTELAERAAQIEREHEHAEGPPRFEPAESTQQFLDRMPDGSPLLKLYGQLLEEDEDVRDRMQRLEMGSEAYDALESDRAYAQHQLELFDRFHDLFKAHMTNLDDHAASVLQAMRDLLDEQAGLLGIPITELETNGAINQIAIAYREQDRFEQFLAHEAGDRSKIYEFFHEADYEIGYGAARSLLKHAKDDDPLPMYLFEEDVDVPMSEDESAGYLSDDEEINIYDENVPEDEFDTMRLWLALTICETTREKRDLGYPIDEAAEKGRERAIDFLEHLLVRKAEDIEMATFVNGLEDALIAQHKVDHKRHPGFW